MNGAEAIVKAAVDSGVEYCFANPGTTEMPFVAAMDSEPKFRPVLSMFEGVCTGAADGYGRVSGRPALTLTHLGPGFANGIANLHNARRANSPIVNLVGDHASWHVNYDPPLASDIESLARPVSAFFRTSKSVDRMVEDFAAAMRAAWQPSGAISTLVLPMDLQAKALTGGMPKVSILPPKRHFKADYVDAVASRIKAGKRLVFIVGDNGLDEKGLTAAGRIGQLPGIKMFAETFPRISHRGGGLPDLDRLPYFPEKAIAELEQYDEVVCAGVVEPIAYFGYEGMPSRLAETDRLVTLADVGDDVSGAMEALAELLNAPAHKDLEGTIELPAANEALTPQSIGKIVSSALPDNCIVSVEGGTCGYPFFTESALAARHRVLTNTGGAIGQGIPAGFGAALAEPGNTVVCLQSDGSAQYTIQALWSIARENLPVVILIAANHKYNILQNELRRYGVTEFGENSLALTELDRPRVDWQALSKAYGVDSVCVTNNAELMREFKAACDAKAPRLIEMSL
ncbi:acetolactate synthase large subunit [Marinomonas spartinae]|uniref:acetolactate synthase large subunit n=1 Tax=Marinomonas spartinae TaxID=1792290 RepID=UPI0018F16936|nr:acetolactate synthase large subunit [Marinomonas spartinae]MBJ7554644.1 acetolactate synthase large subunit [Marinomonas spartinae]